MTLKLTDILDKVTSHALTTGYFTSVATHEPKAAPGNGITISVWVQNIEPVAAASGLDSTTALLELNVRLYQNFLASPEDLIDVKMTEALNVLMQNYSGDFDLGGTIRNVDLLGETGSALSAQAGYLNQDGKNYRIYTINLPLIINDIWSQGA